MLPGRRARRQRHRDMEFPTAYPQPPCLGAMLLALTLRRFRVWSERIALGCR